MIPRAAHLLTLRDMANTVDFSAPADVIGFRSEMANDSSRPLQGIGVAPQDLPDVAIGR